MDPHQNLAYNASSCSSIDTFYEADLFPTGVIAEKRKSNISPLEQERLLRLPDDFTRSQGTVHHLNEQPKRPVKKAADNNQPGLFQNAAGLFRLFVKNGEYVYAKSTDIVMMESCDHLVKVYLSLNEKVKKTVRHNTLKDFLQQLPQDQFMRIGRFCAVNVQRLSGGNFIEQSFEFDFKVSVKLKHSIAHTVFNSIGK